MMDSFSEQIVKQKMDGKRLLSVVAAVVGAVLICAVTAWFMTWLLLPILALCVYGVIWVITSQSWEVEYAVTNGDIDIDRIVARRSRTCIVRVRGAKIESLLPVTASTMNTHYDRVVMAAQSKNTATWAFTYHSKKGSTLVLFEPNDDVLQALRAGLPRLVQIETDRAMRSM